MIYKNIDGIAQPVSRIVFGTATPAMMEGQDATELLDAVAAGGVNCFDTARAYGMAEKSLGDWIQKRGNREKIVLVDKGAHGGASCDTGSHRGGHRPFAGTFADGPCRYLSAAPG